MSWTCLCDKFQLGDFLFKCYTNICIFFSLRNQISKPIS